MKPKAGTCARCGKPTHTASIGAVQWWFHDEPADHIVEREDAERDRRAAL